MVSTIKEKALTLTEEDLQDRDALTTRLVNTLVHEVFEGPVEDIRSVTTRTVKRMSYNSATGQVPPISHITPPLTYLSQFLLLVRVKVRVRRFLPPHHIPPPPGRGS